MQLLTILLATIFTALFQQGGVAAKPADPSPASVKVTILSDTIASRRTRAEWGFAALVEIDLGKSKRYILFDTGDKEDTVLFNAANAKDKEALRVDFGAFKNGEIEVVISHHHSDHTKGLAKLLETYPKAFGKIHLGAGAFEPRHPCKKFDKNTGDDRRCLDVEATKQNNILVDLAAKYKAAHGEAAFNEKFVTHSGWSRVWSDVGGVWMTGAIPRKTNEDNNSGNNYVIPRGAGHVYDNVPDEVALVIETPQGLVVITGCGHAGVINTLEHVRKMTGVSEVNALIGGLHLLAHDHGKIDWTGAELKKFGIKTLVGSHCTGLERILELRKHLDLKAHQAPFGTVETVFESAKGVTPPSPAINSPIKAAP